MLTKLLNPASLVEFLLEQLEGGAEDLLREGLELLLALLSGEPSDEQIMEYLRRVQEAGR